MVLNAPENDPILVVDLDLDGILVVLLVEEHTLTFRDEQRLVDLEHNGAARVGDHVVLGVIRRLVR